MSITEIPESELVGKYVARPFLEGRLRNSAKIIEVLRSKQYEGWGKFVDVKVEYENGVCDYTLMEGYELIDTVSSNN